MAAPKQPDGHWRAEALLRALYGAGCREAGDVFTVADVERLAPELRRLPSRQRVLSWLLAQRLITAERRVEIATARSWTEYVLGGAGAHAMRDLALGRPIRSGGAPYSAPRKVPSHSFAARLWALLRARGVVDAGTAAETLVDAGGDVKTAEKNAGNYLRRWERAGALQGSMRRIAGGYKRFALIKDSPEPPAWSAQRRAQAQEKGA